MAICTSFGSHSEEEIGTCRATSMRSMAVIERATHALTSNNCWLSKVAWPRHGERQLIKHKIAFHIVPLSAEAMAIIGADDADEVIIAASVPHLVRSRCACARCLGLGEHCVIVRS